MNIFGLNITKSAKNASRPVIQRTGGYYTGKVREPFPTAWQRGVEHTNDSVLSNPVLFRCINLIASDIAKCGLHLSSVDENGVWSEVANPSFSPVLRKPNGFQTRNHFIQSWITSLLTNGNTYVLKRRDARNVVVALTVLDPHRVIPLVSPSGQVFYRISHDDLAGVASEGLEVPDTEIIHDRINTLFHPLVGLSPIMAAGLNAATANEISTHSASFFKNGSRPSGILSTDSQVGEEQARYIMEHWEKNFSGGNAGRIAVLEDGLTYQPMGSTAVDSQLIEQLGWNASMVCAVMGIPQHLVGIGSAPSYNNIAALNQQYYSQVLQTYMTSIEELLDEGLKLPTPLHVEFQLDDLIRLDEASLITSLKDGLSAGIISPNEARRRLNLKPVSGGSTPYLQQQNFGLAALAERDSDKPFAKPEPAPAPALDTEPEEDDEAEQEATKALLVIQKGLTHGV